MKKTYIKPENTVVTFNVEQIICESINNTNGGPDVGEEMSSGGANSRETIKSQDVWEEW